MSEEKTEVTAAELVRWLPVAAIVVAGIILFFWFLSTTQATASPGVMQGPM
ncbi:MAG: hypothetical protein HKM89_03545 [Gemmatimonadales bacterium]|nr:hypothetical protein [Gemmatimonadales bacterium]